MEENRLVNMEILAQHSFKRIVNCPLDLRIELTFVEQFNEFLLVKQLETKLTLIDTARRRCHFVPNTERLKPAAFVFLKNLPRFIAVSEDTVEIWLCTEWRFQLLLQIPRMAPEHQGCSV
eukprot:Filipodium_phascolosomae@DN7961_c0_g1_i1.p1